MRLFAITWQTHEGGGGNPPRIAREELPLHEFALKVRWLRDNHIPYTCEIPTKEA